MARDDVASRAYSVLNLCWAIGLSPGQKHVKERRVKRSLNASGKKNSESRTKKIWIGHTMRTVTTIFTAIILSVQIADAADAPEGVLARCGASTGQGYFFYDEIMNPEGPAWSEDGIRNGKILLVRLGDEWDIQFGDNIGDYGYRQDGAKVIPLGEAPGKMTVGAFRGTYADIYTFDFARKEVVWSSHKIGTAIPKAGIYRAECTLVSPHLSTN